MSDRKLSVMTGGKPMVCGAWKGAGMGLGLALGLAAVAVAPPSWAQDREEGGGDSGGAVTEEELRTSPEFTNLEPVEPPEGAPDGPPNQRAREKMKQVEEDYDERHRVPKASQRKSLGGVRGFTGEQLGDTEEVDGLCAHGAESAFPLRLGSASVDGWKHLLRLSTQSGLLDVPGLYTGGVRSATALIYRGRRIIVYSPDLAERLSGEPDGDLVFQAILAHELGHHLNGHTVDRGPGTVTHELQADYYAGFALASLRVPREAAREAMEGALATTGSEHAREGLALADRLAAFEGGWVDGRDRMAAARREANRVNRAAEEAFDELDRNVGGEEER